MNMSSITIQEKSKDKRFPINGKLLVFGNIHSVGFQEGILFITYENQEYQMEEVQIKLENVSHFFIS